MPNRFQTLLTALATFIVLVAFAPQSADGSFQLANGSQVEITSVQEGDVFKGKVSASGEEIEIRLLGVDCPRPDEAAAKRFATKNLVGKPITVASERFPIPPAQDQFDRWVVYLEFEDGRDYGKKLLEAGHCTTKTWSLRHQRQELYASID